MRHAALTKDDKTNATPQEVILILTMKAMAKLLDSLECWT